MVRVIVVNRGGRLRRLVRPPHLAREHRPRGRAQERDCGERGGEDTSEARRSEVHEEMIYTPTPYSQG